MTRCSTRQVMKLESPKEEGSRIRGLSARVLKLNQKLERHPGACAARRCRPPARLTARPAAASTTVNLVRWNHRKLMFSSSDSSGLIIVWVLNNVSRRAILREPHHLTARRAPPPGRRTSGPSTWRTQAYVRSTGLACPP